MIWVSASYMDFQLMYSGKNSEPKRTNFEPGFARRPKEVRSRADDLAVDIEALTSASDSEV